MDSSTLRAKAEGIVANIEQVIFGKRREIELAVAGLLCRGHVLIEDKPGTGKTVLAKAIAISIDAEFSRIQFTADLLPSDISGVSIYDQGKAEFRFQPGPIFAPIVLADEINRATPKAQASLLECMDEYRVTVDGVTRDLPKPFFVLGTENPIEYHGTYPLPEAQLDRFLLRLSLCYLDHDTDVEGVRRQARAHAHGHRVAGKRGRREHQCLGDRQPGHGEPARERAADQPVQEHAVRHRRAEVRAAREPGIAVDGVVVARQRREAVEVALGDHALRHVAAP